MNDHIYLCLMCLYESISRIYFKIYSCLHWRPRPTNSILYIEAFQDPRIVRYLDNYDMLTAAH